MRTRIAPFRSVLKSPCFCLRSQAEYPHITFVLPIGDEFRERIAFRGTHEKFGKRVAQSVCNDKLRWRDARPHGSKPGPERGPNELGSNDREILEQPLGDNPSLNEDMISMDFAYDMLLVAN